MPVLIVLLVATFGLTLRSWTRHVHPALGARMLLAASTVTAATMVVTFAMLALPVAGQSDVLADFGHWSEDAFASGSPSTHAVGLLATLAVAVMVVRVLRELLGQRRAGDAAEKFRRDVGAGRGEVVVAATDDADAMALGSGVIVVTTGLVSALDADQRRALLAHERAHLTYHHHRYLRLAKALVAVNPLLFRVPDTLTYLTERWADEEAAQATSRSITAATLETVALASSGSRWTAPGALRAAAVGLELRLRALASEPPTVRWPRLLWPLLLVLSLVIVALVASERTVDLVQLAAG